jgi:hypothetical protein
MKNYLYGAGLYLALAIITLLLSQIKLIGG